MNLHMNSGRNTKLEASIPFMFGPEFMWTRGSRSRCVRDRSWRLSRNGAFTLIELAVVIVVIAVLAGLVIPRRAKAKWRAQLVSCTGNLKNIGLSFRIFANDNGEQYPDDVSITNGGAKELVAPGATFLLFRAMSNELSTPRLLTCWADRRPSATNWSSLTESNLSYFIGLDAADTTPMAWLLGDRNLSTNGMPVGAGLRTLTTNVTLGYTKDLHRFVGNIVLGDGSVQFMNRDLMRRAQIANGTNRLLIP